ncbi:MAG TPA: glycosyltransferase [Phycisphaerae bacterium]|nr:glycosyltransferase [Phycisphaerae bacterium]
MTQVPSHLLIVDDSCHQADPLQGRLATRLVNPGGIFDRAYVCGARRLPATTIAPDVLTTVGGPHVLEVGCEFRQQRGCRWLAVVTDVAQIAPDLIVKADRIATVSPRIDDALMAAGVDSARILSLPLPVDAPAQTDQARERLIVLDPVNADPLAALPDDLRRPAQRVTPQRWSEACLSARAAWIPTEAGDAPLQIAQALAAGVPVVADRSRTSLDLIEPAQSGYAVAPGDLAEAAAALTAILHRDRVHQRLAEQAAQWSWPHRLDRLESVAACIYRSILRPSRPLVSVVLPTYNRAARLRAAIASCLAQTYENLELIVVDDGSSDGTCNVVDSFGDPRLRYVRLTHVGLPRALNAGFAAARGNYLTWTSDDNTYEPDAIETMVNVLNHERDVGMVCCGCWRVDEGGSVIGPRYLKPPEMLYEGNCVGACFLYRAELARRIGPYRPELALAEDYDYWLRLARVGRIRRLNRLLYRYCEHSGALYERRYGRVLKQTVAALRRNATCAGERRLYQRGLRDRLAKDAQMWLRRGRLRHALDAGLRWAAATATL